MEHKKSAVRCKVEHPFLLVKRQMGYAKVVYREIAKNMHRFPMLFASANLLMCSRAGRTKDWVHGITEPILRNQPQKRGKNKGDSTNTVQISSSIFKNLANRDKTENKVN